MVVEKIGAAVNALVSALGKVSGVGTWLFLAGFVILLVIGFSMALTLLIRALKELPNLTVSQFLKLTVITAIALMIIGLVIP
ncbi:hypothetical protein [Desulfurococcus mucosus]|uniref:Uncharacterized protein n=1 Tax=Desulfurococcus mucosus (strain ATCC 35584 / DSM 2162 / JCM 9187 / O7/1) TaxID=765177 RepID=E8RA17_DESM0|nr:hypothetical protein [Desulfurococcus mucosus]ADV65343.1 hypothetical protein Desmu_1041 [Desulfurococcus mucosus DSM 2162]